MATLMPGDFVLYDTTRPYELTFDEDFSQYVVALPGHVLRPHLTSPDRLTARRVPGGSSIGRAVLHAVETVACAQADLGGAAARPMEEALCGLLTAGVLSLPGAEARPEKRASGARRAAIKAYALQYLCDPELSVSMIAAAQGIDSSTVHRAFEHDGETVTRWIWGQRLENARRDLCDPAQAKLTITDIAFSWGFNDMAHFSRAFKTRFGQSPRAARKS